MNRTRTIRILLAASIAFWTPVRIVKADTQPISCDKQSTVAAGTFAAAGTQSLVPIPGAGNSSVYICGWLMVGGSTAATMTLQLEYGLGAACSGPTVILPPIPVAAGQTILDPGPAFKGLWAPPGNGVCGVAAGGTVAGNIVVFYAQR